MSLRSNKHSGTKHLKTLREFAQFILMTTEDCETTQQAAHELYLSNERMGKDHADKHRELHIMNQQVRFAFVSLINQYGIIHEDNRSPHIKLVLDNGQGEQHGE